MRTIILAAGQGFNLDGCIKLLIKDPKTGGTFFDHYLELFRETDITVVVGYKAIEIMQKYPNLHYVYNHDWKVTNNSYSLGLALNDESCFVVSCDLFFGQEIVKLLFDAEPNCILTDNSDNRQLNSLNCSIPKENTISEIYQGPVRSKTDPEAIGVYKISDKHLLNVWKKQCIEHGNLFAGQNLGFDICPIYSVDKGKHAFHEVNTVMDYMRLIEYRCL